MLVRPWPTTQQNRPTAYYPDTEVGHTSPKRQRGGLGSCTPALALGACVDIVTNFLAGVIVFAVIITDRKLITSVRSAEVAPAFSPWRVLCRKKNPPWAEAGTDQ